MKKMGLIIAAGWLLYSATALGQEVYRWVDEKGIVHFTDDFSRVPEKYQDQIQQKVPSKEAIPSQPASSRPVEPPKAKEPGRGAPKASESGKDMLGRGEEWWKATANEWHQKFVTYRTNYENANNQWKAKQQELEESKFKPDSVKRKLKSEMKVLEEKVKEWEKETNHAKDMIENVLPKEASDYRANPEWLKIEEKK